MIETRRKHSEMNEIFEQEKKAKGIFDSTACLIKCNRLDFDKGLLLLLRRRRPFNGQAIIANASGISFERLTQGTNQKKHIRRATNEATFSVSLFVSLEEGEVMEAACPLCMYISLRLSRI